MTEVKHIDMEKYQWGHFGTILFHLIVGGVIIYYNRSRSSSEKRISFWAGVILFFVSLLALLPIFNKDYDKIIIG